MANALDNVEHDSGDVGGEDGPTRLCIVTRQTGDPSGFIRFVAAPDGEIVPDLAGRLPGRGVWVTAERRLVEQAVRQNSFAKSLKRKVKASEDLGLRVESLIQRRALDALAIANKAGIVTTGFAQVDAALQKGGVVILVHGSDAAAGGREKLDRKYSAIAGAHGRSPQICVEFTIEQISLAIGGVNVVHAALNHGGAASKFATEAGRLKRYRSGPTPLQKHDSVSLAGDTTTD